MLILPWRYSETSLERCRPIFSKPIAVSVAAIPVSAFYPDGSVRSLVRLCFAKADATLDTALARMRGVAGGAA